MIEVELPDGTIAEFPDGTSQDVMRSALQKRFGGAQKPDSGQSHGGGASGSWDDEPVPNTAAGSALRSVREPLNAVNRAFTNLYTLGSLDEIEGAADAAMSDQSFGEARNASRERLDQQRADYPAMTTAAGLAGAVTSPAAQAV